MRYANTTLLLGLCLSSMPIFGQKVVSVTSLGVRSFSASSGSAGTATGPDSLEFRREPESDLAAAKAGLGGQARVPAAGVPAPGSKSVSGATAGMVAFDGLNHRDQRLAGGGNQFSLEPPDQGLAVGGGFLLEAVNLALAVRDTNGNLLGGPVALNDFFGLPSAINRTTVRFGPFLSDPKAYWDAQTGRFFLTVLEIDTNPVTGDFLGKSRVLIAVSATPSPLGAWYLYSLDTTNDGSNGISHPGCPCLGDQPLIGADANGFFVTTNEFPIFGPGFNGAQVYATSKTLLAAGTPGPVVFFGSMPLAEGISYTLQPATVPPGGVYESAAGGTEYFLSALEFTGGLDNRIAVWAMTNTSSLNTATPAVTLTSKVIASQVYGQPPAAQQQDGYRPLAVAIAAALGKKPLEKAPLLDTNDDRMNQVVFAGGKLYSAVNTIIKPKNGPVSTGIAYFIVTPSIAGGTVSGTIYNQGYVAVNRATVMFPAIGINKDGKGAMVFTLVGPDYFPSAAYTLFDSNGAGDVHIAKVGAGPDDGITGYAESPTPTRSVGRWGDYSAAVADAAGNIWMATEYIPNAPRTLNANWGTAIVKVAP